MENTINYVNLRKDISFDIKPLNPVDALVFSELAYVNWDFVENEMRLQEALNYFFKNNTTDSIRKSFVFSPKMPELIDSVSKSNRYKNIIVKNYKNVFDEEKVIQFSAVTFLLENQDVFVAYRGTDGSINGWKENMNMLYKEKLECEILAKEYLQDVLNSIPLKKSLFRFSFKKTPVNIYVGGHSKGGHLAMVAAIENPQFHPYIRHVYNFDGPGFKYPYDNELLTTILDKIITYRPESSIIGRMLIHPEKAYTMLATQTGLAQHDPSTWSVNIEDFNYTKTLSKESDEAVEYIEKILLSKDDQTKKEYTDMIFYLIDKLEIKTLNDFQKISLKQSINGLVGFSQLKSEEKKFILEVVNFFRLQTMLLLK